MRAKGTFHYHSIACNGLDSFTLSSPASASTPWLTSPQYQAQRPRYPLNIDIYAIKLKLYIAIKKIQAIVFRAVILPDFFRKFFRAVQFAKYRPSYLVTYPILQPRMSFGFILLLVEQILSALHKASILPLALQGSCNRRFRSRLARQLFRTQCQSYSSCWRREDRSKENGQRLKICSDHHSLFSYVANRELVTQVSALPMGIISAYIQSTHTITASRREGGGVSSAKEDCKKKTKSHFDR